MGFCLFHFVFCFYFDIHSYKLHSWVFYINVSQSVDQLHTHMYIHARNDRKTTAQTNGPAQCKFVYECLFIRCVTMETLQVKLHAVHLLHIYNVTGCLVTDMFVLNILIESMFRAIRAVLVYKQYWKCSIIFTGFLLV